MKQMIVGLFVTCFMAYAAQAVIVHWWVDAADLSGVSDITVVWSASDFGSFSDPYAQSAFDTVSAPTAWSGSLPGIGDATGDTARSGGYYYLLLRMSNDWSEYKYAGFTWDDSDQVQFLTGNAVQDAMNAMNFDDPEVSGFTVVPEPSSMALLSLGVAVLALRRRRTA